MCCSPAGAVPNRVPWQCWFQNIPISRACELYYKKPEFSLDQYYLTRNVGVLLEKICGAMKGFVLDHLFYPEFSLEGWRIAGGYTAAQLEAAQNIWLSKNKCVKKYCYKPEGTQISAWAYQMRHPKAKWEQAGQVFDLALLPLQGPSLSLWSLKKYLFVLSGTTLCTGCICY